jgi:glycosyltransferase involved in cell wall biosynthesis
LNQISIKSISWLFQINFGGVENRALKMATYLSKFADVELVFAKAIFSDTNHQRYLPEFAQKRINRLAKLGLKFADVEFLLAEITSLNTSFQIEDALRYHPIQIYFNPYMFYKKRFWEEFFVEKTTKYFKKHKNKIDLVHGQGISGAVGINLGMPTITTIRGVDRWGITPPKLKKMVVKKSNKLIAVTEQNRSLLLKKGVKKEKISVIYAGVDFQGISDTKIESNDFLLKYGINPEKKIILSVHNFHHVKNTRGIIDSFIKIKRKYPDYQLVLIGDGSERLHYVDYAKKKDIKDIHFPGKLFNKDLYQFYKSADIFFLPSFHDTFPLTCLEAMAAKCAVIMTKNTSMMEIAENKKHAIFIDPISQPEIDQALSNLIEDNNIKEYLKQNGCKLAATLDWEKQGDLLWQEVQQILR